MWSIDRCRSSPLPATQEREAKKDTWKARWFKANPGGPVFDGEHPEDKCPLWDFTGEALQRPKRPVQPDGTDPSLQLRFIIFCVLAHVHCIMAGLGTEYEPTSL